MGISRLRLPQAEAKTAHSLEKLYCKWIINLPPESSDLHINDVIDWRKPGGLPPDISREHFAGHRSTVVFSQVEKKIKLARRQVEQLTASGCGPRFRIKRKVSDGESRCL